MQAMLMSNQVNHVNSGPEILLDSFVNPVILTSFLIIHYNATMYYTCMYIYYDVGTGYKEVTLKNHGSKRTCNFAWKSFFVGSILNCNIFNSPCSCDACQSHNTL